MKEKRAMVKISTGFKLRLTKKTSYFQLLSIRAPKWQSAFCKTRLLAGQTENAWLKRHFPPWFWLVAEMSNNFARPMRSTGYRSMPELVRIFVNEFSRTHFVVLEWTIVTILFKTRFWLLFQTERGTLFGSHRNVATSFPLRSSVLNVR